MDTKKEVLLVMLLKIMIFLSQDRKLRHIFTIIKPC